MSNDNAPETPTPDEALDAALSVWRDRQASARHAPAGHSDLACAALGDAEVAIFDAAARLPAAGCPTCSAVRAMGLAGYVLRFAANPSAAAWVGLTYDASGGLLFALADLWAADGTHA